MGLERIRTNPDGEHVQFRPDAAASFRRMEAQQGRQLDVNRTVVDYDVQADLYAKRQRGEYPYKVAHPDESDHVYRSDTDGGNAWDTDERGPWLEENGWIADVSGEPWHRRYVPSRDQRRNAPTPTPNPITQLNGSENEMIWIARVREAYYLVVPQGGGKPRAVQLGGVGYQPSEPYAKIPQINFEDDWSIDKLRQAVDGL